MPDNPLYKMPMLKLILPAAVGIALAYWVEFPLWAIIACGSVSLICAVLAFKRTQSNIYVWSAVMLFFLALTQVSTPRSRIPAGERIVATVQVRESPYLRGRWQISTADVGYFRPIQSEKWVRAKERINLYIDTSYHNISVGAQLSVRGWFNPIDTTGSSYGSLMRRRGIHGRLYLTPGNLIRRSAHISKTPTYYASHLQQAAIRKLERLKLDSAARGVVTAMVAGDKRPVDRELRSSYSRTGAAHLLAVSGLHVGIVFMLINLLLYPLPAARRGHLIKNALAIAAVWLFAAMSGLAPSAVRAALMFSFAQLALATTSYSNGLNILLGSALIMLAVNPNYASDPGFLLSYAAVLSIFIYFGPLYRLVRTRWGLLNALISITLVGLTASLGVAPLVMYWFGNLPLASFVINPIVTLTAHLIVMLGVIWVLMPFGVGETLFSWMLNLAAWLQNIAVGWLSERSWAAIRVDMPVWGVLVFYVVFISAGLWLHWQSQKSDRHSFIE